jgi:Tol biopolymer transport system component
MNDRTISHYRILEKLGEGGMGAVYRAEDMVLRREVAIKLLHRNLDSPAEVRMRLLREARTAAALSHPNICTVYEVGEVVGETDPPAEKEWPGNRAGTPFIVMEFIRGNTLQTLLAGSRQLPLKELVSIAIQVSEGLVAAHARKIVHRDLKPGNVIVDAEGRAKILDFGLAKPLTIKNDDEVANWAETQSVELSREGNVVGTIAYMSPEQALGKSVDSRGDVFALGIMLYEMAVGVRPFQGATATSTIAKILEAEPRPVGTLREGFPSELERIIHRCLQKNPNDRYHDTRDLLVDLKELQHGLPSPRSTGAIKTAIQEEASRPHRWRWVLTAGLGLTAAAVITAAVVLMLARNDRGAATPPSHKQITFVGDAAYPTISPDGKFLAYVRTGFNGEKSRLIVQDLGGGQPLTVLERENLRYPVWSKDGSELSVLTRGVRVPIVIVSVPRLGGSTRELMLGGVSKRSWSPDGSQFAVISQGEKTIRRVDKITGKDINEIPLTGSFEFMMDVDWSPAGDLFLFVTLDDQERYAIWTTRLEGSRQEKVLEGDLPITSAHWSLTGDSIYYIQGHGVRQLAKVPVIRRTGKSAGSPEILLSGLQAGEDFTISSDGKQIAYLRRAASANLWLAPTKGSPGAPFSKQLTSGTGEDRDVSISPDGRQIAFSRSDGQKSNIFVMPVEGGEPRQLTFLNSINAAPVWSPDGKTIAFGSTEGGNQYVWRVSSNGGTPRPFEQTRISSNSFDLAWAPNQTILYHEPGNRNFQLLDPIAGGHQPLLHDSSVGWIFDAHLSPDGTRAAVAWNNVAQGTGLWTIPIGNPSGAMMIAARPSWNRRGFVTQTVDASGLRGREVKLRGHVKTNVSGAENQGNCLLRIERPKGQTGFARNIEGRPIQSSLWYEVEIIGRVDTDAERIVFGCFLSGAGQMWVDDIQLRSRNATGPWEPITIQNPGFEEGDAQVKPLGWTIPYGGYSFQVTESRPYQGNRCLSIKSAHVVRDLYPIAWSADGTYIYVSENGNRKIMALRADGGDLKPMVELPLSRGASIGSLDTTPGGQFVVYSVRQVQSDVWIVENFDNHSR